MSELVVFVFMRFLMTAREGVTVKPCFDRPLHVDPPEVDDPLIFRAVPSASSVPRPTEVPVQLPGRMVDSILAFGVFDIITGSLFDAGRSFLSLYRSREVEWALVFDDPEVFLLYTFESGRHVFLVPSLHQGTRDWSSFGTGGFGPRATVTY